MPSLGPPELILILVIVLILFGPGKLTGLGTSLGKSIKEFRKATSEPDEEEENTEEAKTSASKTVVEETKVARRPTVTVAEEHSSTVETSDREVK